MGNILTATVTVRGTRPLLWHHFGPDAIPLEKGEKSGVAGNNPDEWKKTVLATTDGQLYVEPTYVFGCIRNGAKYTKKGRGSIQATVASTLQVLDGRVLINRYLPDGNGRGELTRDDTQPVYLDVRSVTNPSTRGRNVRYRIAAGPGWETTFRVAWDKTMVSRGEMQAVLRDAGMFFGLGDGLAVGFGRFEIVDCDIQEN